MFLDQTFRDIFNVVQGALIVTFLYRIFRLQGRSGQHLCHVFGPNLCCLVRKGRGKREKLGKGYEKGRKGREKWEEVGKG